MSPVSAGAAGRGGGIDLPLGLVSRWVDGGGLPGAPRHPAAMQQDSGLKSSDDHSEARWLAPLLRLGVLPAGYIYPKAERAGRDWLRQRAHWGRQPTANVRRGQNLIGRNTGARLSIKRMRALPQQALVALLPEAAPVLAITSSLAGLACLSQQIKALEKIVHQRLQPPPSSEQLWTVKGIGPIVAQTSALETGDIRRFPSVGTDAAYCRGVASTQRRHGKRTGQGNGKNGHPYLGWAYREAAQFARRLPPNAQRFSQRKLANSHTNTTLARKTIAPKLARAGYDIMRDLVPFEAMQAFG